MSDGSAIRAAIADETRRLEEGVAHYEQTHRLAAARWRLAANMLGGTAAIAGSVGAGLAASQGDKRWYVVVLSAFAGAAAAALTFFKPAERSSQHAAAVTGFNLLRHDLRRLRVIELALLVEQEATERLAALVDRRSALVTGSPMCSERVYKRAAEQLRRGLLEYTSDAAHASLGKTAAGGSGQES